LFSSQSFCCFHEGKWDAPISERVFPIKGKSNQARSRCACDIAALVSFADQRAFPSAQYCTNSGSPYSPLQCFTTKCIDSSKQSCLF
jgi:hypothetical protein